MSLGFLPALVHAILHRCNSRLYMHMMFVHWLVLRIYNWGIHRKRSLVSVIASLISLISKFLHVALLKRTKVHANECCELREVTREVMIINIMPTAVTTHPMTAMASHVVQVDLAFSCVSPSGKIHTTYHTYVNKVSCLDAALINVALFSNLHSPMHSHQLLESMPFYAESCLARSHHCCDCSVKGQTTGNLAQYNLALVD